MYKTHHSIQTSNETRGYNMKSWLKRYGYYILALISIIILDVALIQLFIWKKEQMKLEQLKQELEKTKQEEMEETSPLFNPPKDLNDSSWNYVDIPFLQIDFTDLLIQNRDTVGWIQIDGTNVDYPIVQSKSNEYYLTHAFDHSYTKAGWIFSDYRNNLSHMNPNTVIYGHGRRDNSMFGSLRFLLDESWYQNGNQPIIKISTSKANYLFQIFSIYTIVEEGYYITTHFKGNEFQTFIDTILSRSQMNFHTSVDTNDKILTLSTCLDNDEWRVVVHAKLLKKETR